VGVFPSVFDKNKNIIVFLSLYNRSKRNQHIVNKAFCGKGGLAFCKNTLLKNVNYKIIDSPYIGVVYH